MNVDKPIVGIPVFQDRECLEAMLSSLINSTNYFERIIIVESDNEEYWNRFEWMYPDIEVIHTQKEGPLKAYNKLFEIAKRENKDLLITQTDVLFPKLYKRDWLYGMSVYASHKDIGLVIPINGGGVSGDSYVNGFNWVGGWCTFISKKCWEIFKGYDENYPMGYGVDIDMSWAINKKYLTCEMNYWVDHHMMNSREHDNNPKTK